MQNNQKKAFTLIEFLIVITILIIIGLSTFIPYHYYGNKLKLNQSVKEVVKTISQSRNMAINGVTFSDSNLSLGTYISKEEGKNTSIQLYSFPYNFSGAEVDISSPQVSLVREFPLHDGVQIEKVGTFESGLFFFHAISGMPEFYVWDSSEGKKSFFGDTIDIELSFKGSDSINLRKKITYFLKTNISNY